MSFIKKINILLLLLLAISCSDSEEITDPGEQTRGYQVEIRDSEGFNFLLFLPENESQKINNKYPTILFLHGIGELGNDLQKLKQEGLPKILDGDKNFPFIVISPQCPSSTEWYYTNEDNVRAINNMLDDAIKRFPIDTNRIYITGLSMGGIGAWYFAHA